jgi:hypothetical protein
MKHFVQKFCNRGALITVFCVVTFFSSCNDDHHFCDDGGEHGERSVAPKPTLTLDSFQPHDYGNEGNASDIFLTCGFSGTLDRFAKLRFILKLSPSGFNIRKALTLSEGHYVDVDVQTNVEVSFPKALKDADGMRISEGKSYSIFILGIPSPCSKVPVLIEGSEKLTLKDEIVVTTPKLKGTLSAMEDVSIDQKGNLYISGGSLNTTSLFKVTPDGTITALSTTLSHPVGNMVDDNGNVYVTNFASLDINLITPTGVTSVFARDERLFRGGGIIQDKDGALYNTFWAIKTIYRITAAGVEDYLATNLLNGPIGLAYDKTNDHIFVANFNDGKIFRLARDKTMTEVAQIPASIGHLDYRDGVLYATGWNEHKVFVVSTNGEILATIGSGNQETVDGTAAEASFFRPNGIAVSKDGKYLFISQGNGTLRKIVL